ncbi:MAG: NAD(P)/FAD-dependent oxidoreductase [Tepidimonas sp.]|uniref:NAD(P)/FAD-dependent oxidoreductase n=1 Tax=Tepidimonas sp. TaxID=2002775 RepID=UPI00298ED892|nr:NAD(P)/FAD-dependent oxidoreductase [Tepidimonas sp.]MCS6810486.1 NAD(P)/FAD-dependent oxidoreductase [Tepidimonas sp.]MDW8336156.1 NAD(P)/FAD-dependent oxidoreductase [Tepidimonas sp.]
MNVIIIGAGPAGLTAGLELIRRSDIKPLLIEADSQVGGISKTVVHRGNRMDLGGHRFFSKSDWVMDWWQSLLPIAGGEGDPIPIHYHRQSRWIQTSRATPGADCMLVRPRLSRIYFLRRLFDYPLKLNWTTLANLGPRRVARIMGSYARARLAPRPERNLEDFIVNRFGEELYRTFFKDYTEKVWGVPCQQISAEWGAQRIKGLSITEALKHAAGRLLHSGQVTRHTSLIERFLYPRLGPGHLWEMAAREITNHGGTLLLNTRVVGLQRNDHRITGVDIVDQAGQRQTVAADHVISTMPVKDLIAGMSPPAPHDVQQVAQGLLYRDFITVGLLVRRMKRHPGDSDGVAGQRLPDNWIYIQEKEVRLGRLQIFNNWSPDLVADPDRTVWLGLEYFCNVGDDLWSLDDAAFTRLAIQELASIDLIDPKDVLDSHLVRVEKAYPAYFGSYAQFGVVRQWVDGLANLWLVGRNGMHRYNNQDHSMLTAKLAVDAILGGDVPREAIWAVNLDDEYHETIEHPDDRTAPQQG